MLLLAQLGLHGRMKAPVDELLSADRVKSFYSGGRLHLEIKDTAGMLAVK